MYNKFVHPENADAPILVVLIPTVTFVKLVTPVNVDCGIYPETVIDAGKPANAFDPTEVIDVESMLIVFKAEQF